MKAPEDKKSAVKLKPRTSYLLFFLIPGESGPMDHLPPRQKVYADVLGEPLPHSFVSLVRRMNNQPSGHR